MKTFFIVVLIVIAIIIALYFLLIGTVNKTEPKIVKIEKPIHIIGIEINTNDNDIYKDVERVASKFNEIKMSNPIPNLKQPWASINLSKDYNENTKSYKYVVGDVVTSVDTIPNGLYHYEVPVLTYAVFSIRPKSKVAWGITMGRMKKYIYGEWLPKSGYEPSDSIGEFELHDDRSLGKKPEIQLYVALKEKSEG